MSAMLLSAVVHPMRFLFDPVSGQLQGMEMFAEEGLDPCEIRFKDYNLDARKRLPHALEVHHGDEQFGTFEIERITTISTSADQR